MWLNMASLIWWDIFRWAYVSYIKEPKQTPRRKSSNRGNWENPCRPKASTASSICTNRNKWRRQNENKSMSSPLLYACPLLPLYAAVCGCFLSLCAEEYMTVFLYKAALLICTSQGIQRKAKVKERRDCGKNPSGGTAGEEQKETPGTVAFNHEQAPINEEGKRQAPVLPGSHPPISHWEETHNSEWFIICKIAFGKLVHKEIKCIFNKFNYVFVHLSSS